MRERMLSAARRQSWHPSRLTGRPAGNAQLARRRAWCTPHQYL